MMYFVISIIGVLVFVGLTAYDTQKIKNMYLSSDSGELIGKKAVMGALTLYLDFINLFIMLLRLFGQEDKLRNNLILTNLSCLLNYSIPQIFLSLFHSYLLLKIFH